jgi:hypothetical protein
MRICSRCKEQIKRGHRYHIVASRLLGFLWTVKRAEHYSCPNPTHGPSPKRLRGEVPLPFPEQMEADVWNHGHATPSSRQELADLN